MADPSDAQLNSLHTAQEVANYVGFDGAATAADSMRGSFFLLLGLTDTTQVATLGHASESDFDGVIATWKIGSPPLAPSLSQLGAAKMFWRIGAIRAGTLASKE